MKNSSRSMETTKRRVHVFRGQNYVEPILSYLNRKDRPKDDPVERYIRLEWALFNALPWERGDLVQEIVTLINGTNERWDPGWRLSGASGATIDEVPIVFDLEGRPLEVPIRMKDWSREAIEAAAEEQQMSTSAQQVYEVKWMRIAPSPEPFGILAWQGCKLLKMEEDLLYRIRLCARPGCGEWFFAKFDHQKCHSDDCRVAMLSTDEARNEARKKYMRNLRAEKKVKKFRSPKSKGGK